MKHFMADDFLLQTKTAQRLYFDFAAQMPVFDYHCHLSPKDIADDIQFETITQAWLYGDHYKWRAMRTNGIHETYCTGEANDWEKFEKWAQTVPYTLRNPLYHWTHLELKRYFGIDILLNPNSAKEIYDTCNEMINSSEYSTRNLLRKMNVKAVCTTDDPLDTLEYHQQLVKDGFEIKVLPTWRPDKAMTAENTVQLNAYIDKLASVTDMNISTFDQYEAALQKRHDYFHENGCRLSDHGLEAITADYSASKQKMESIFSKIRNQQELTAKEIDQFKSKMMLIFAQMDWQKNWVQQLHLGAMRNNNTRMLNTLGPDTGFDSIGDYMTAEGLSRFLDIMDRKSNLPKTILYNLNPRDNAVMATMIGNFQDGSVPGKLQFGSGWWFLDQKDGMERQIEALSNLGLLSRFVGMLTDSRSFLSYPRHEYFRRILCNILGTDVEAGLLPNDMSVLGTMVENISFNNSVSYFNINI